MASQPPPRPEGDEAPELGEPPSRGLHWLSIGTGLGTLGIAAVAAAGGAAVPLAIVGASGALNVATGAWALRHARGVQLLQAAANLAEQGRPDLARRLVARALARHGSAPLLREAHALLASIALAEGAWAAAIDEATQALSVPSPAWYRGAFLPRLDATATRALARALAGDLDGARADALGARAMLRTPSAHVSLVSATALSEATARVAVAEAVVLSRSARPRLRAHLERHAATLERVEAPRERAVLRALERVVAEEEASPYRRKDDGDAWLDEVAAEATAATPAAARAPARGTGALGRTDTRDWGSARRIAGLVGAWVAAVAVALSLNLLRVGEPARDALFAASIAVPVLFLVAIIAYAVARVIGLQANRRAASGALLAHAAQPSPAALAALDRLDAAPEPLVAAQAKLVRAREANRRGDFERAAALADEGLARVQGWMARGAAGQHLLPALAVERALAHAALGRRDDALREVAALPAAYAREARSSHAVRLAAAARAGELDEARRLVLARPPSLPIDGNTEALEWLVRATAGVEALEPRERRELEGGARRAWLLRLAPALVAELDAAAPEAEASGPRLRVGMVAGRDDAGEAEAEREALGAAEAPVRARGASR